MPRGRGRWSASDATESAGHAAVREDSGDGVDRAGKCSWRLMSAIVTLSKLPHIYSSILRHQDGQGGQEVLGDEG